MGGGLGSPEAWPHPCPEDSAGLPLTTEPLSGGEGLLARPGRPGFSEGLWIDTGSSRKKIKLKKAACHAHCDQGLVVEGEAPPSQDRLPPGDRQRGGAGAEGPVGGWGVRSCSPDLPARPAAVRPGHACYGGCQTQVRVEGRRGKRGSHDMISCKIRQRHTLGAKMWVGGGVGAAAAMSCKKVSEFP